MAYPNSPNPFPGLVGPIGARWLAIQPIGHAGPSSYVQLTTAPVGNGDVVLAVEFGLKWIEHLFSAYSSDGLYFLQPINPISGPVTSVHVRWVVLATGSQVAAAVNLSASSANMMAVGMA